MKNNTLRNLLLLMLLLFTVGTRLLWLGERSISHDESLHAYYSWQYSTNGTYQHDPMMHGPLLFHLTALSYRLFGDSDATSRLFPALCGIVVVGAFLLFRRWIGGRAALLSAVLAASSPTLLFYSRYIRNDIYIALLLLIWIYCLFRYLEKPAFRWLAGITIAMAFSFACKEVTFMHTALFTAFTGLLLLRAGIRNRKTMLQQPALDLFLLQSILTAPMACPFLHYALQKNPLDHTPAGVRLTLLLAGAILAICLAAFFLLRALNRKHRTPLNSLTLPGLLLLFWVIMLTLYTSLWHQIPVGLTGALASSLGYWMAQHSVQRGSQPLYYYLMLLILYNPLLLLGTIGGAITILRRRTTERCNRTFGFFLVGWALTALLLYSAAGERMPWLLMNCVLPMIPLTAIGLLHLYEQLTCAALSKAQQLMILLLCILGPAALLYLPTAPLPPGNSILLIRFAGCIISCAALITLLLRSHISASRIRTGLYSGMALLLVLYALFNALRHSFVTYDSAAEHLVFAHASGDVKALYRTAKKLANTGPSNQVVAAFDQHCAWPLSWYFRSIPHRYFIDVDASLQTIPLICVGPEHANQLRPLLQNTHTEHRANLIWWPVQSYMHPDFTRLGATLLNPLERLRWWAMICSKDYDIPPGSWPLRTEFTIFTQTSEPLTAFRSGTPSAPVDYGKAVLSLDPALTLTHHLNGPLLKPRAACMYANRIAVADSGHNAIAIYDQNGTCLSTFTPAQSSPERTLGHCPDQQPGFCCRHLERAHPLLHTQR